MSQHNLLIRIISQYELFVLQYVICRAALLISASYVVEIAGLLEIPGISQVLYIKGWAEEGEKS